MKTVLMVRVLRIAAIAVCRYHVIWLILLFGKTTTRGQHAQVASAPWAGRDGIDLGWSAGCGRVAVHRSFTESLGNRCGRSRRHRRARRRYGRWDRRWY